MNLKRAPKPSAGEVIELEPLQGKAVAVKVSGTRNVETKFGSRPLAEVTMIVETQKEPLQGVLFQAYFTKLPENEWYAGILKREKIGSFEQWLLDSEALTSKQAKALESIITSISNDDVPF